MYHLRAPQQQHCSMSTVCYEGGVGGRSRAGLRLSLNRSISEPGPATPPITVSTPTNSKRFRLELLPSLPASLPASPTSECTNLSSALVLNKVCVFFVYSMYLYMCIPQSYYSRYWVIFKNNFSSTAVCIRMYVYP